MNEVDKKLDSLAQIVRGFESETLQFSLHQNILHIFEE
jgi:hypothetical protein